MSDEQKENPSPNEKRDLIKMLRTQPLAAMLLVGFLVASVIVTLGVEVLSVYNDSQDRRISAHETEFRALSGACNAEKQATSRSLDECRIRLADSERNLLNRPNSEGATESLYAVELERQLRAAQGRIDSVNMENERLAAQNNTLQVSLLSEDNELKSQLANLSEQNVRLNRELDQKRERLGELERTHRIEFELATQPGVTAESDDLISIVFSNRSALENGNTRYG